MSALAAPARSSAAAAGVASVSVVRMIARKRTRSRLHIRMSPRRTSFLALICALLVAAPARADVAANVDPMIGTFAPGFVFPGASVPFGMVQNSPDTVDPADLAYTGYLW